LWVGYACVVMSQEKKKIQKKTTLGWTQGGLVAKKKNRLAQGVTSKTHVWCTLNLLEPVVVLGEYLLLYSTSSLVRHEDGVC